MKHLKKSLTLALAALLVLGVGIPALAAVEDTGFSDVDANTWYAEAVLYCREHSLMGGTGSNRFAPESNLTRAQLATVLYRIEGTPAVNGRDAFTDTPDGAWYSDAVLWASQQNLVSGYGGGLFGPNDPVSREQMTTILWRYAGSLCIGNGIFYRQLLCRRLCCRCCQLGRHQQHYPPGFRQPVRSERERHPRPGCRRSDEL